MCETEGADDGVRRGSAGCVARNSIGSWLREEVSFLAMLQEYTRARSQPPAAAAPAASNASGGSVASASFGNTSNNTTSTNTTSTNTTSTNTTSTNTTSTNTTSTNTTSTNTTSTNTTSTNTTSTNTTSTNTTSTNTTSTNTTSTNTTSTNTTSTNTTATPITFGNGGGGGVGAGGGRRRRGSSHNIYLPNLEKQYCRDFSCCGLSLPSLHDLLKHYEDVHIDATNPPPPQQQQQLYNVCKPAASFALSRSAKNSLYLSTAVDPACRPAAAQLSPASTASAAGRDLAADPAADAVSTRDVFLNPFGLDRSHLPHVQRPPTPQSASQTSTTLLHQLRYQDASIDPHSVVPQPYYNLPQTVFRTHSSESDSDNESATDSDSNPLHQQDIASASTQVSQVHHTTSQQTSYINDPARKLYVMDTEEGKPFKCPVLGCDKNYKNQNGLKYHKIHGHQHQKLQENPDGTFTILDPYSNEPVTTDSSEAEKPYRCEVCGKRYKNLNGLKYHRGHSTH